MPIAEKNGVHLRLQKKKKKQPGNSHAFLSRSLCIVGRKSKRFCDIYNYKAAITIARGELRCIYVFNPEQTCIKFFN
ncbi:hypothetical protein SDC9_139844 [bioreactor metagenome]|uniref:Uncharacterized protein n=1 Tax=bioreactor metagenome TaxID=1076179 RepID=A0A645DTW1_9ZZZZ